MFDVWFLFFNALDLLPPPHGLDPGLRVTWAGEAEVIVGHGVIVSLRGGQVHVINRELLKQWDNVTLRKQDCQLLHGHPPRFSCLPAPGPDSS